jgi:hypothetical protein
MVKPVSKKDEVNRFLGNFKNHLSKRGLLLPMRPKNKQTLTEMGFTKLNVEQELLRLDHKDFISGPEPDDGPNMKGDIWKFGKIINKENIYIKIKLTPENKPVCISFHYPERELRYFFK